ncbi:MAG: heavy-metal-associated domain-containing protein [Bacilli bacterium]|nr:heavy-metal-associated domain-containing protein [Bacilli bacterium]
MLNKKLIIKVSGLNSKEDVNILKNELNKIKGIKSIKVYLKNKKVILNHVDDINILELKKGIEDLGYKYIGVE